MNIKKKSILSVIVLAILAFSTGASFVHAAGLPFQQSPPALVNANTITVRGSSTVLPIAQAEGANFQNYWNNLVAANPSWGASSFSQAPVLEGLGSGTAIPDLSIGTADVGEMSRPPNNASNEWFDPNMVNMQIYAVGIDSVAIVASPDMTWLPQNLTTAQVARLFVNTTALPALSTWNDFFTYLGASTSGVPANALSEPINRAVREPTSGTFDAFNNFFGNPNVSGGFLHKTGGIADGSQNMATYTLCPENIDIYNHVSTGTTGAATDYIGFIALGYLQSYGNMIGENIAFNIKNPPASTQTFDASPTWGPFVAPTEPNVIWAFSGNQGASATGQYWAWRYLWEVIPTLVPSTGTYLSVGVWVAYMRATNTTTAGNPVAVGTGSSDFVADKNYIELSRADIAGTIPIDGALAPHGPLQGLLSTQSSAIPDGKVNFKDLTAFVQAYIAYFNLHIYNPYSDIDANGKINFNDLSKYVTAYIAYFTLYIH